MGHTNSTVNYNLPQFVGTDKPSWLGDVNGAFLAIDNAIAAAKTTADSAAGGVAGLQTTVGSHTTQIGTLTDTVTAQGGTLNSVTALIGNGTPTTTDKTIIGAINELNTAISYEELKTGTENTSYGSQIAELKTVFDNLTMADRRRCGVIVGGNIFRITVSSGNFSCDEVQSSGATETFMISMPYSKYIATAIATDGTVSYADYSAIQYSGSMKLVLLN